MNPLEQILQYGQSIWLDSISRDLINSGELQRLVSKDKLRGVTSNPTIFEQTINRGNTYDDALRVLLGESGVLTAEAVEQFVRREEPVPEVTAVRVEAVDLSCFDQLLEDREVWSGESQGSENDVAGAIEGAAFAGVP